MTHHTARLVFLIAVIVSTLMLAACSETPAATTQNVGTSLPPTTAARPIEVSDQFLAFAAPMDATDRSAGWDTYEWPLVARNMQQMAICLDDSGFLGVGEELLESSQSQNEYRETEMWLFPEVPASETDGFVRLLKPQTARSLLDTFEPGGLEITDLDHPLVIALADNPNFGLEPTLENASGLNSALWGCLGANLPSDAALEAFMLRNSWVEALATQDRSTPEILDAEAEFVACAQAIDPVFQNIGGIEAYFANQLSWEIDIDESGELQPTEVESTLKDWGRQFATCYVPLANARAAHRTALREEFTSRRATMFESIYESLEESMAEESAPPTQ